MVQKADLTTLVLPLAVKAEEAPCLPFGETAI
jgi:hypothetical protein